MVLILMVWFQSVCIYSGPQVAFGDSFELAIS